MAWLIVLVGASVEGVTFTLLMIPPGQDMFDTNVLYWSIMVVTVLAALAGWYVPKASYYWGLAIAPPYFVGFVVSVRTHPAIGADLSFVGFFFLFGMLMASAACALAAGLTRRALK